MSADFPGTVVGIIGVGNIGIAIAERLLHTGHEVIGYRRGSLDEFSKLGGRTADSAAAVATNAASVMLILPNNAALMDVVEQIAPSLRQEQLVVCLSSHPLEVKRNAARLVGDAGAVMLDGEVSGTPEMLRTGQASIFLAGDATASAAAKPILENVVPAVVCMPRFGDALRTKLIANCLVGVHTLAAAEALSMGVRIGLDPQTLHRALASSAAGSRMLSARGPMMLADTIGRGDLDVFLRFYDRLRLDLRAADAEIGPLTDVTQSLLADARDAGFAKRDLAMFYPFIAERLASNSALDEPE